MDGDQYSKWNHMNSISVESISENERNEAFHCWAEGSEALEKLLHVCYDNQIKTNGCNFRNKYFYLGVDLLTCIPNNEKNILKMIKKMENIKGADVEIETEDSHLDLKSESFEFFGKPSLTFGYQPDLKNSTQDIEESENEIINRLKESIECDETVSRSGFSRILDLYDFFKGKNTFLEIRMNHTLEGKYEFLIYHRGSIEGNEKFNGIFSEAGMELVDHTNDRWSDNRKEWKAESDTIDELDKKIEKFLNIIKDKYDIPDFPKEIPEDMPLDHMEVLLSRIIGEEKFIEQMLLLQMYENQEMEKFGYAGKKYYEIPFEDSQKILNQKGKFVKNLYEKNFKSREELNQLNENSRCDDEFDKE